MKRKKKNVPSCVYKYRLYEPTENADKATAGFEGARVHYNKLVTIENRRRYLYRNMRSRLHPELASLEARQSSLKAQIAAVRGAINDDKRASRSRRVDPGKKLAVANLVAEKKRGLAELREIRKAADADPDVVAAAASIDAEAKEAVKALRKETYWGTYLLVEASARQAFGTSSDPEYDETPPHLLKSRIGVHFCNGLRISDLPDSRLMRFTPGTFKIDRDGEGSARGVAARRVLRFRVGSEGRDPVWISLPMVMHRPIPADALVKDAFITRRPCSVRVPWRYDLCVVVEAPSYQRSLPSTLQEGTTTVNFGWRSVESGLRVAMVSPEGGEPREVVLPRRHLELEKCRHELSSLLSKKFNEARDRLSAWLATHDCPDGFRQACRDLPKWRSQHRLYELAQDWQECRFEGDEEIYSLIAAREPTRAERGGLPWTKDDGLASSWCARYRHLGDWLAAVQRKLVNSRTDLYRRISRKIAETSAKVVVEAFDMRVVAKRPAPEVEKEGGQAARTNRQIAAPGELREKILAACSRFHCEVVLVSATNNTRRCDVCGELHPWDPSKKIDHDCPGCGARWDQDVNNCDRQHARVASGEVASLVIPAEKTEISGASEALVPSRRLSMRAARKMIPKSLTIE